MPVPLIYRRASETAAQYSYLEILTNIGYISLYPIILAKAETTKEYGLVTSAISGNDFVLSASATNEAKALKTTAEFKTKINKSFFINGECYFSYNFAIGGNADTRTAHLVITLIRTRGATNTTIGTVTAEHITKTVDANGQQACKFSIASKTELKSGDILNLKLEMHAGAANGNTSFIIGTNPGDDSYTAEAGAMTTRFTFLLPTVIDI